LFSHNDHYEEHKCQMIHTLMMEHLILISSIFTQDFQRLITRIKEQIQELRTFHFSYLFDDFL
jgi:hypothetical protein